MSKSSPSSSGSHHHHLSHHHCQHPHHRHSQQPPQHNQQLESILCSGESCNIGSSRKGGPGNPTFGSVTVECKPVNCENGQHPSGPSKSNPPSSSSASTQRIIINPLSLFHSSYQPMLSPSGSRSIDSSGDSDCFGAGIPSGLLNGLQHSSSSANPPSRSIPTTSSSHYSINNLSSSAPANNSNHCNNNNSCNSANNSNSNVIPLQSGASSTNQCSSPLASLSIITSAPTVNNNLNLNSNSSFKCVSQPSYSPPASPTNQSTNSIGTSPLPLASGPEVTSDPNWQASKPNVRERNAAMFNNELMSDITFVVGPKGSQQKIPAHKYVLATGSAVFFAMFYGGLAEASPEIEIPDIEPAAFFALLRYIYCDDICLEADSVLLTLYAAKKYLVPHLARACVEYLETSITARNACVLLNQSRLFEEPDLMKQCWEVIDAQAELALSEGISEIDLATLETILNRETLNAKEANIFQAASDWASVECSRRNLEPTPDNQRKVLDKAIFLIRIPTMSLEEFANGPAQSGLLSLQETTDIFLYYTARTKPILSFPAKKRLGLNVQICHRFPSSAYRNNQWRYRGRCDSIQFTVDRRIFLVGFGLYGSSNAAADYKVRMELKRMGKVLASNHTKFFSDGSSNTFRVFFSHPIQIEAETFYTASVILDGDQLSFFGQEGLNEVTTDKVTFNFHVSSDSTNGTNVHGGQIPELLFYGPRDNND